MNVLFFHLRADIYQIFFAHPYKIIRQSNTNTVIFDGRYQIKHEGNGDNNCLRFLSLTNFSGVWLPRRMFENVLKNHSVMYYLKLGMTNA